MVINVNNSSWTEMSVALTKATVPFSSPRLFNNNKSHGVTSYTDHSITTDQSGWRFAANKDERTVHEDVMCVG